MARGNVIVEIKCKQELLYLLTNCIELVYYNLILTFNLTKTIKTTSTNFTWLYFYLDLYSADKFMGKMIVKNLYQNFQLTNSLLVDTLFGGQFFFVSNRLSYVIIL